VTADIQTDTELVIDYSRYSSRWQLNTGICFTLSQVQNVMKS